MISELYRHGARTPLKSILPESCFEGNGVCELGKLVPNGMRQHILLGEQIALIEYPQLFKDFTIEAKNFRVISSPVDRCLQSAESHNKGLTKFMRDFEVTGENGNHPELLKPPYPTGQLIQADSLDNRALLGSNPLIGVETGKVMTTYFNTIFGGCPYATMVFYKKTIPAFKALDSTITKELTMLSNEFKEAGFDLAELFKGEDIQLEHFGKLKDSIMSYFYYNRAYPRALTDDLYEKMSLAGSLIMVQGYEANNIQVNTSKVIQAIFDELDSKILAVTPNRKYFGLSGHDSNLVPILVGLGLSSTECLKKCFIERMKIKSDRYTSENTNERICSEDCLGVPGYASNIVFELTEKQVHEEGSVELPDKSYFLRVILNGRVLPLCPIGIDKSALCPYDDLKKLFIEKFVLSEDEFNMQCFGKINQKNKKKSAKNQENKISGIQSTYLFYTLVFIIIALLIPGNIFFCIQIFNKKKAQKKDSSVIEPLIFESTASIGQENNA